MVIRDNFKIVLYCLTYLFLVSTELLDQLILIPSDCQFEMDGYNKFIYIYILLYVSLRRILGLGQIGYGDTEHLDTYKCSENFNNFLHCSVWWVVRQKSG